MKILFFFFCISDSSKELLIGHSGVHNDVQEIPAVFESFAAVPRTLYEHIVK